MTPNTNKESEGWFEYRLLLLQFCEETKDRLDSIEEKAHAQNLEVNTIKVRWGIVSALIGFGGALIPILLQFMLSRL